MHMQEEMKAITAVSWKRNALIIGAVAGLAVGALAAYMFIQQREDDQDPDFTAGDGVKLGVMVLGLLRGISAL
jgi:hypothetical protein